MAAEKSNEATKSKPSSDSDSAKDAEAAKKGEETGDESAAAKSGRRGSASGRSRAAKSSRRGAAAKGADDKPVKDAVPVDDKDAKPAKDSQDSKGAKPGKDDKPADTKAGDAKAGDSKDKQDDKNGKPASTSGRKAAASDRRAAAPSGRKEAAKSVESAESGSKASKSGKSPKVEAARESKPEKTEGKQADDKKADKKDDKNAKDSKPESKKSEAKKPDSKVDEKPSDAAAEDAKPEPKPEPKAEAKKADDKKPAAKADAKADDKASEPKAEEDKADKKAAEEKPAAKPAAKADDKSEPKKADKPADKKAVEEKPASKADDKAPKADAKSASQPATKSTDKAESKTEDKPVVPKGKKKPKKGTTAKSEPAKADTKAGAKSDTKKDDAKKDDDKAEAKKTLSKPGPKAKKAGTKAATKVDSRAARPQVKSKKKRSAKPKRPAGEAADRPAKTPVADTSDKAKTESASATKSSTSGKSASKHTKSGKLEKTASGRRAATSARGVAAAADADVADALHVEEKLHRDDVLTQFATRAGDFVMERWRSLSFLLVIVVIVGIVIAVQIADTLAQQEAAWRHITSATSIGQVKERLARYEGTEYYPLILKRLIDAIEENRDDELDPQARLEQLIENARNFASTYETNPEHAAYAKHLRFRIEQLWEPELEFVKAKKPDADKPQKGERPQALVILPGETQQYQGRALTRPALVIRTEHGVIMLELFHEVLPNSVANAMFLARNGFYDFDGPGGDVARQGGVFSEDFLELGGFPELTAEQPFSEFKAAATSRDRYIDDKWAAQCEANVPGGSARGFIGYFVNPEADAISAAAARELGISRTNTLYTVALKLNDRDNPKSASTRLIINLEDNARFDGYHRVIGRVYRGADGAWDKESIQTIRRIGSSDVTVVEAFPVAYAAARGDYTFYMDRPAGEGEQTLEQAVAAVRALQGELDQATAERRVDLEARVRDAKAALDARFREHPGAVFDPNAMVLYCSRVGDEYFAIPPAEAVAATHLWVGSGVLMAVPAGEGYKTEGGEWKAGGAYEFKRITTDENGVYLPLRRIKYDRTGKPLPANAPPTVRYPGWPTPRPAALTPPTAPRPLRLPGEPMPAPTGQPPAGMPGGMPPTDRLPNPNAGFPS